jgi:DNA-directed RNA polymerase II subunit RPB2
MDTTDPYTEPSDTDRRTEDRSDTDNVEQQPEEVIAVSPIVRHIETLEHSDATIPGEINVDEHGRLLKSWIEYEGLTQPFIEAYDKWIIEILPLQIASRTITIPEGVVRFERLFITKPSISNGDEAVHLLPQRCRLAGYTYSANMAVDIVLTPNNGGQAQRREKVPIGKVPVMLRSVLCHLRQMDKEELERVGECRHDPGGYFIVKGAERLCLIQEKLRMNRMFLFNKDTKGNVVCRMTCPTIKGSTIVTLSLGKKRGIKLALRFMGKNKKSKPNTIGVFQAFRLLALKHPDLGAIADSNVMMQLVAQHTSPENIKRIWLPLQASFLKLSTVGSDIEYLARKKGITSLPAEMKKRAILDDLENELFPQINGEPVLRKVQMLAAMICYIAEYLAGLRELSDRDSWSNKRLVTAAGSMEQLMMGLINKTMDQAQEEIQKKRMSGIDSVKRAIVPHIITDEFVSSFNTTNWGVKGAPLKENICDTLNRYSATGTISHLMRANTPTSRQAKQPNIRLVQLSQLGYVCPAETPEGEGCGLLKYLAVTCYISLERDETRIRAEINAYIAPDPTPQATTRCWLNGKLIGFCMGEALRRWCVHQRRTGAFYKDMCIVLDKENSLWLYCDGSRPTRPLLIVDEEDGQLVIHKKGLWLADMNTLRSEGCLEYIDAYEQEYILLAQSRSSMEAQRDTIAAASLLLEEQQALLVGIQNGEPALITLPNGETTELTVTEVESSIEQTQSVLVQLMGRRWYTHCEVDPSAYLGHSASVIPLPNHNQAPRNTYQCSMSKQALGIYHSNQAFRFDNMSKTLAFPTRPLFEPQLNETFGLNDLPGGFMATVAIMTYGGFNQEDAFIFNKSAVQRGLGLMVKRITAKTIQRQTREFTEEVRRPEIRKNEPAGRYANIDENGLTRVGSQINPGDCIIGKVRRNNLTGVVENASVFAGVGEQGIVDSVLVTPNAENMMVVKVTFREVRQPIIGDKFASRSAQKGTIAQMLDEEDMPFTAEGVRPDIIINPHAIPGRMTIGKIIEFIASKVGAFRGERMDATAHRPYDLDMFRESLRNYGFREDGYEKMYSGVSGKPIKAQIYIGPVYYQALRHHVADKIQYRSRGAVKPLTHQPVGGRGTEGGGGLRFSEMNRDAVISWGATEFLKERLCLVSDAYKTVFCRTCGTIAIANHVTSQYICRNCRDRANFGTETIPYTYKLLTHLLAGCNINMRLGMREADANQDGI